MGLVARLNQYLSILFVTAFSIVYLVYVKDGLMKKQQLKMKL